MANLPVSTAPPTLDDARRRFIQAWGDMASSWGISKTMAQVYALLYASNHPLDTDEIMAALDISRGNANMNLHKLLDWQIVTKADAPTGKDTRKEHFIAEKDVWTLCARIVQERNDKEIQPVVALLHDLSTSLDTHAGEAARTLTNEEAEFQRNLKDMSAFLQVFQTLMHKMLPLLDPKRRAQLDLLLRLLKA